MRISPRGSSIVHQRVKIPTPWESTNTFESLTCRAVRRLQGAVAAEQEMDGRRRVGERLRQAGTEVPGIGNHGDRKSTRLNSSHQIISYAVFCLKKKNKEQHGRDPASHDQ